MALPFPIHTLPHTQAGPLAWSLCALAIELGLGHKAVYRVSVCVCVCAGTKGGEGAAVFFFFRPGEHALSTRAYPSALPLTPPFSLSLHLSLQPWLTRVWQAAVAGAAVLGGLLFYGPLQTPGVGAGLPVVGRG